MSGKSETVRYTRLVHVGRPSDHDKEVLIEKITAIIEAASDTITIEAMVQTRPPGHGQ
jgi:hypothetical protein